MFKLTLVTPEKKLVVDQEIEFVSVPAFKGQLNILPGHTPIISTLETGVLSYRLKSDDKVHKAVISWGYCQVTPKGVNVLAEFLQAKEDIDHVAAKQTIENENKKLVTQVLSDEEYIKTQNTIAKAQASLEI